ncbi:hemin transporter [Acinetobacter populi]|uniref:Hemin transporter n=1 Tax=Acinetobacter populi TaxID=1582270 RepID=A0A1Z9YV71_9GAMM|nr:hemin transporter [Acinetobacter populi]
MASTGKVTVLTVCILTHLAYAADPATDALIRQQQRDAALEKQMQPDVHVSLQEQKLQKQDISLQFPQQETPCFNIKNMVLTGDDAQTFRFYLYSALKELKFKSGMCLGAGSINQIMTVAQNKIIDAGYTTTRILAAPQNLTSGKLRLTVIPGRIRTIKFDENNIEQTHVNRIKDSHNVMPFSAGDILNLRQIEQGLENLKRLPTVEADIEIVPADLPNESDIIIKWQQRTYPFRMSLSADNSGSDSTGRFQGSATLSIDHPLHLSDLFYVTYSRDLADRQEYTDIEGNHAGSGTNGYTVYYSAPYKNWLFSIDSGKNKYHQAVAGDSQVYTYSGESKTSNATLSRLVYRDAHRKTTVNAGMWLRSSRNYIDDTEIEIQRRRTAGWQIGLEHSEYIGAAMMNASINYKRGTGAWNALTAPEEQFGEGTHLMQILNADLGLSYPFKVNEQLFIYTLGIRSQWNQTPLVSNDQFSIGSRYTVRGFDEKNTLMAERGWYVRNDFAWQYQPAQQFYVGLDAGHVSGASAEYLVGQTLAGTVAGFKGQFQAGGRWSYDLYMGTPVYKPRYFRTDDMNIGFNLFYSF